MNDTQIKHGMKRSNIVKKIDNKLREWHSSLNSSGISFQELKDGIVVTGGCITSMLLGEEPNDYDIYFRDEKLALKLANYYLPQISHYKNDETYLDNISDELKTLKFRAKQNSVSLDAISIKCTSSSHDHYSPIVCTGNAITLKDDIQIILRFIGEPAALHKKFDFIHCTNYWTDQTGLVLNQLALESILSKSLYYQGSDYPICAMFRVRKFIERGWNISAGTMLKIMYDVNQLNLSDMSVLHDQLVGVDTLIFSQMLENMKQNNIDFTRENIFKFIDNAFDFEFE